MNLTDIIRSAVERLPTGDHEVGLRSVVTHIERAIVNLERGQHDGDEEWFRDAIYRCNQAFEGSVKEAYRVLAGGDPSKKTPHEIEQYIENNKVIRERVFKQLARYRREWRNPSTHDYNLDFDENEAFLAIVNVCAFAKVLVNEIAVKLAYDASAQSGTPVPAPSSASSFTEKIASHVGALFSVIGKNADPNFALSEAHWVGSLAGYLDVAEGAESELEARMPDGGGRADMIVRRGDDAVVIELKRHRRKPEAIEDAKLQLLHYLNQLSLSEGILALFDEKAVSYDARLVSTDDGHKIFVVRPS